MDGANNQHSPSPNLEEERPASGEDNCGKNEEQSLDSATTPPLEDELDETVAENESTKPTVDLEEERIVVEEETGDNTGEQCTPHLEEERFVVEEKFRMEAEHQAVEENNDDESTAKPLLKDEREEIIESGSAEIAKTTPRLEDERIVVEENADDQRMESASEDLEEKSSEIKEHKDDVGNGSDERPVIERNKDDGDGTRSTTPHLLDERDEAIETANPMLSPVLSLIDETPLDYNEESFVSNASQESTAKDATPEGNDGGEPEKEFESQIDAKSDEIEKNVTAEPVKDTIKPKIDQKKAERKCITPPSHDKVSTPKRSHEDEKNDSPPPRAKSPRSHHLKKKKRKEKKSRSHSSSRSRERSRSRSRSPPRSYDHRQLNRKRSYSRSRSPSYEERQHYSHKRSKRSRSRSRSRSPSYDERSQYPVPRYHHHHHRAYGVPPPVAAPSRCLGVFGMSFHTSEKTLYNVFSAYGDIENIHMVYDRPTGHSRGFAFIYFKYLEDAVKAKEHAVGWNIDGHMVRVDFSVTKGPHRSYNEYDSYRRFRSHLHASHDSRRY